MDKEDVVHTHTHTHTYTHTHTHTMEYYSAIKKNEIMPFAATWMDLEIIILSEVNQTEKDKYHVLSLIFVSALGTLSGIVLSRAHWVNI